MQPLNVTLFDSPPPKILIGYVLWSPLSTHDARWTFSKRCIRLLFLRSPYPTPISKNWANYGYVQRRPCLTNSWRIWVLFLISIRRWSLCGSKSIFCSCQQIFLDEALPPLSVKILYPSPPKKFIGYVLWSLLNTYAVRWIYSISRIRQLFF